MSTNKRLFIKGISLVMAVTLSAGLFAGCGKTASDKDEQGRTIVSVGDWPAETASTYKGMMERKEKYEAENTDVVIVPDKFAFDRQTFYSKAAGGRLPIVYSAGFTEMPEIIASNYAADLTDVLKKRGYDGMFDEKILKLVSDEDGNVMAFPNSAYVLGLSYNTKLMEAAGLMEADGTPKQPKDWYEVAEFAVKIKEATGKAGFMLPTSANCGGWLFTPIAWSFGVDFMEKGSDGKWKATFDTPEAVEALQYIKDLKWKYEVLPENTIIDLNEYYKQLAIGNVGMCTNAGSVLWNVVGYEMKPEDLGMMAYPAGPKRHVTLLGGSANLVASEATEDQIDAAIRWLETKYSFNLTEEFKKNTMSGIENQLKQNVLVGIKSMSVWSENSEALKWEHQMIEENANINMNHVKLYNDFVANCPADIQAEEPVCAQELYAILDGCIQAVLMDKDADCAALIKDAAVEFQSNYLDNLTY